MWRKGPRRFPQATGRQVDLAQQSRHTDDVRHLYLAVSSVSQTTRLKTTSMPNPEDEILVNFATSCTKEEAVARLLGWMQGHIRQKNIRVTEHGISADQLLSLHSLDGSLQEQLIELREAARMEFVKAAETGAALEVIQAKEEAVKEVDNLIEKAGSYFLDIDDELAKGGESDLRIDQSNTESSGVKRITLRSIDRWANKKYGITIPESSTAIFSTVDARVEQGESKSDSDELGKTKTEHIYTTLAFLVEAFVERQPKYSHGGKPNATQIAERLAQLVTDACPDGLSGQDVQTIRKLISKALAVKQSAISKR